MSKKTYAIRFNEETIERIDTLATQYKINRSDYIEKLLSILIQKDFIEQNEIKRRFYKMETETNRQQEFRLKELQRIKKALIIRLTKSLYEREDGTIPDYVWKMATEDIDNMIDYSLKLDAPKELLEELDKIKEAIYKKNIVEYYNIVFSKDENVRAICYHIAHLYGRNGKVLYNYIKTGGSLNNLKVTTISKIDGGTE